MKKLETEDLKCVETCSPLRDDAESARWTVIYRRMEMDLVLKADITLVLQERREAG
jgi:hypothetical protein